MKKIYLLLIISVFSVRSFSQTLIPSTIGEVYNFEVGDTFETNCGFSPCPRPPSYYNMIIIESKYSWGDSVIYIAKVNDVSSGTYSCQISGGSSTHTDSLIYTLLDSSIFWNHYHANACDSNGACIYDTVYIDSTRNNRKSNKHYDGGGGGGNETIYAEGLGVIKDGSWSEDFLWPQGDCQLMYYHKANGEKWGTPYYFIVAGINDLNEENLTAYIFPNPSSGTFQLQLSEPSHQQTYFKLYDALGREVKRENISSITTTLNRENLSNGIYFWQAEAEGKILGRGKLVFE